VDLTSKDRKILEETVNKLKKVIEFMNNKNETLALSYAGLRMIFKNAQAKVEEAEDYLRTELEKPKSWRR